MTASAELEHVLTEVADGVLRITLNRPAARNALGWPELEQLDAALSQAAADDITAVVIAGEGSVFCAGADLKSNPSRGSGVGAPAARLRFAQRVMLGLDRLEKPCIAAVEGPAVGIGWAIVLACDLVFASDAVTFASPFLARGLVPDGGVVWWLTAQLGRRRAMSLMLSGEKLTARQALELGLVTEVVPAGEAAAVALRTAAGLSAGPPDATKLTKRLVRKAEELPLSAFLDIEWLAAALNLTGPDPAEGRAAFAEKRAPVFAGSATRQASTESNNGQTPQPTRTNED